MYNYLKKYSLILNLVAATYLKKAVTGPCLPVRSLPKSFNSPFLFSPGDATSIFKRFYPEERHFKIVPQFFSDFDEPLPIFTFEKLHRSEMLFLYPITLLTC